MRLLANAVLVLWLCLAGAQARAALAEPFVELESARRAASETVGILAHGMTVADPSHFPGIQAWLKEYRTLGGFVGRPEPGAALPRLDGERHVSRSAVFWRAYFEQSPGDAFSLLWHGALLLAAGEASRAAYVFLLARQVRGAEPSIQAAIDGLLDHAQLVVQLGARRVAEAGRLHDDGNPAAAADRLRVLLAAWPQNALAHYELGLAAASRQHLAAGRKPPPRSRLSIHAGTAPAAEVVAAFARARSHDPLLIRAYLGNETRGGDALLVLGKTVRPVWDIVARDARAETSDENLWRLANGLQAAGIAELSITAGQVLIGREGGYDDDDRRFVAENLRHLAPAAVEPVSQRLARTPAQFIRFILP